MTVALELVAQRLVGREQCKAELVGWPIGGSLGATGGSDPAAPATDREGFKWVLEWLMQRRRIINHILENVEI